MKVELQRRKREPDWSFNPHISNISVSRCLPFYQGNPNSYVHRIRYGTIHNWQGEYSHTSFQFWCGGNGFLRHHQRKANGSRGRIIGGLIYAVPPDKTVSCATCEGRAIGAGLTESRMIAGRMLVFSPR